MDLLSALQLNLDPAAPDVVSFVGGGGKSSALFHLAETIAAQGKRVITTSSTHLSAGQAALAPITVQVAENQLPLAQIAHALAEHNHCLLIGPPAIHKELGPDNAVKTKGVASERRKGISPSLIDELVAQSGQLGISAVLIEADGSKRRPVKAPAAYEPVLPGSTNVLISVIGLDAIGQLINEDFVHRPELLHQMLPELLAKSFPNGPGQHAQSPAEGVRLTPAIAAHLLLHPNGGAKNLPNHARHVLLLNKADAPVALALARLIVQTLPPVPSPPLCLIGALGVGALVGAAAPIRERWAPIAVVVLAAGQSRRMGSAKQLAIANGDAMIVRAAHVALQSNAAHVMIVTGAYAAQVEEKLRVSLGPAFSRLQLLYNPQWESGQASSVRCAIQNLAPPIAAATIMPVDQPFLTTQLLKQIFQQWRTGAQIVAPLVENQMRGAPALFDRSIWPELESLEGDIGARTILRRHQNSVSTVETTAIQLQDIDTPDDLAKLG